MLALPNVEDPVGAELVSPELWGEIQLCWDRDNGQFSLHIPYTSRRSVSAGKAVTAIGEGIIKPMALATWVVLSDRSFDHDNDTEREDGIHRMDAHIVADEET
ncbi:MAG: hypothetical protein M0008_07340, partial [Actinomycetota bacterium]|nr:hypothetical protein [Actinomycetota bacterium]